MEHLSLTDIEENRAYELAERLRCAIAAHAFMWKSEETPSAIRILLTASFGLATYPLDGITRKELIETADARSAADPVGRGDHAFFREV